MTTARRSRLALALLVLAAAGCKTEGGEAAQPPREPPQLTLRQVTEEHPAPPRFERVDAATLGEERKGFGPDGEEACLPLPSDRSCLEREDAEAAACAKAGGHAIVCEDCRVLCSVEVPAGR